MTVRIAHDDFAMEDADRARHELDRRPLERALLSAFAELVGSATVGGLGCGPGRITAHLRDLGVPAFGIDLSPEMIAVARRDHPDLRLEVGAGFHPYARMEREAEFAEKQPQAFILARMK